MTTKTTKYYERTEFGDFETHSKTEHTYCLKCDELEQQLKEAEKVIEYYVPILEERLSCGAYARKYLKKYRGEK